MESSASKKRVSLRMAADGGTIAAVRHLAANGFDVRVLLSEFLGAAAWSRFTSRSYAAPCETENARLLRKLLKIGETNPGQILLATSVPTAWLCGNHADLLEQHFRLYQAPLPVLSPILDKGMLAAAASKAGVAQLPQWDPQNEDEVRTLAPNLQYQVLLSLESTSSPGKSQGRARRFAMLGKKRKVRHHPSLPAKGPLQACASIDARHWETGAMLWRKGLTGNDLTTARRKIPRVNFFGHFGSANFGNEATLQAILFKLRLLMPDAEFTCICTYPETAGAIHNITARPISRPVINFWRPKNRLMRRLRSVLFGIPSELYRWWDVFKTLRGADSLIVAGTGLLTDAFGLSSWGPYSLYKWSLVAKLCGCKLFFVSVGAGPICLPLGRRLAKSALGLADYRSYRDLSSLEYLKSIGFTAANDSVYPDLAFSLPKSVLAQDSRLTARKPIVGLGLMHIGAMYGNEKPDSAVYQNYLDRLVNLVKWLLDRQYNIRLLIGESGDPVSEFQVILRERLSTYDRTRISFTKVTRVDELLLLFSDVEFVVATRFHNIVFALLNGKPIISISFHQKCTSLMSAMGLSKYCLPINEFDDDIIIASVLDIEKNYDGLTSLIGEKTKLFSDKLEEQYRYIVAQHTIK
jgi:polysaccharide pyruvyl transferase WcaK-like protein